MSPMLAGAWSVLSHAHLEAKPTLSLAHLEATPHKATPTALQGHTHAETTAHQSKADAYSYVAAKLGEDMVRAKGCSILMGVDVSALSMGRRWGEDKEA